MFDKEFYEMKNCDIAKAEIDGEFGVIVLDKKLFSLKRLKRCKLKLIVKNGEFKKIKISAPYSFIVKLFETFNYKPLISDEHNMTNKLGVYYRRIYNEEWYNPHYSCDDSNQTESIFDHSNDLPF